MNYILKVYTYDNENSKISKILMDETAFDASVYEVIVYRNKSVVSSPNSSISLSRVVSASDLRIQTLYDAIALSADGDTIYLDVSYQENDSSEVFVLIEKEAISACRSGYGLKTQNDAGVYEEVLKEDITINFAH